VFMNESGEPSRMFGIHLDITERKSAEEALRKSEEKFRRVVEHIGDALFVDNVEGQIVFANERFLNLFGYSREELPDIELEDYIAPEYRATLRDRHDRRVRGEAVPTHFEYEGRRRDGKRMWLEVDVVPVTDENDNLIGTQSALRDITERKRTEEALSDMTRKLVEAQEQERARIARELHDDITQRLAMLAIEIEQVKEHAETPSEVGNRVHELSNRTKDISSDVQALSHELHSSKLEYLGIVGGMKSWCREFGERRGMEIEFKSSGLPNSLPSEISLCLFRVLQEALNNAAKHSGVERVDVQLREESGEIHLIVSDLGKGFDVASAMQDRGLGVTSMQERVRLVGGTIVIDSKPLGGTTIHVRVPLGAERSFQRARG
jgi:PAS domain S-box-containing protein